MGTTLIRTLTVLRIMLDGHIHTRKAIAAQANVCTRTVSRHIDVLHAAGFEVERSTGPRGGYKLKWGIKV